MRPHGRPVGRGARADPGPACVAHRAQLRVRPNPMGDALFQAYIFLPYLEAEAETQRQQQ